MRSFVLRYPSVLVPGFLAGFELNTVEGRAHWGDDLKVSTESIRSRHQMQFFAWVLAFSAQDRVKIRSA